MSQVQLPSKIENIISKLYNNVNSVIYGRKEAINKLIIALLAGGHVLLEDVPGIGKTLLAKVISKSIDAKFTRVQCTPDLMPTDITGISIYNNQQGEFKFIQGPLFTNVLLVDEINRAAPRTQSCLLEAMEEMQITIEGKTYSLEKPFFVIATQNPLEYHGTFELPEAQLDRFLMIIDLGYPKRKEEVDVMNFYLKDKNTSVNSVITKDEYLEVHTHLRNVVVSEEIKNFIMDIAIQTRDCPDIKVGVSTRGVLALLKTAQASAIISNRNYVIPDDVINYAENVLAHRIITCDSSDLKYKSNLILDIVSNIKVPV